MEQTDMAEEFAKQTIQMLANAFGVSAEDVSDDDGDDDGISIIGALRSGSRKAETSRMHFEGANIGKIIGIIAIALAAAGIFGGVHCGAFAACPGSETVADRGGLRHCIDGGHRRAFVRG